MELLRNTFLSILFFTFHLGKFHEVAGQNNGQQCHGNDLRECCASTTLLTSVMRRISEYKTPFIILHVSNIVGVWDELRDITDGNNCNFNLDMYPEEDDSIMKMFQCVLNENNVLTVKVWQGEPSYLSLAVHDGDWNIANPIKSAETFCNAHFKPTCTNVMEDTGDTNICQACFETFQTTICASIDTYCSTMVTKDDTTPCHSYDAFKGNGSQSGGADILPIVIASIASFIAGVIVCLLVLCLLQHRCERSCFKSATSQDGSSKPKQETHEGLQGQSNRRNIPEYLGLQDVNPESRTELGAKRPQPSAPQQAIVYETSDKRRSEHVYSELGDKPTNGPGEYESTYPNRSSNHVYQGIQGNTNPDIPSRHQTNELPENERGTKGHINGAMGQDRDPISETDGADGCYSQKHDYFVLEKENHKPNESEMSAGTKSNGQGFLSGSLQSEPDDKNTQHNDYFVLEKETHNPNESGTSAGTMSDGQGRLNDSLQSEPDDKNTEHNEYFVLEKENKAVNEVERVEDIKIDDTHLEADDDVDDDYHSYHVLEKQ